MGSSKISLAFVTQAQHHHIKQVIVLQPLPHVANQVFLGQMIASDAVLMFPLRGHAGSNAGHQFDLLILPMSELHAVLGREHSPAVEDAPLNQGAAGIRLILHLQVDNHLDGPLRAQSKGQKADFMDFEFPCFF